MSMDVTWQQLLVVGAAVLFTGIRNLKAEGSNERMFLWSALGIFVALYFGRFIHDNYIGTLLSIAVISQTARGMSPPASSTSAAG